MRRKNANRMLQWAIVVLAAVLVLMIGTVLLMETRGREGVPAVQTQGTTETTESTTVPPGTEGPTQPPETMDPALEGMFELETPYCVLYFPELWEDYLVINPVEDPAYRMEFWCRIEEDVCYPLFTVSFGSGEGVLLGEVADYEGDPIGVYLECHSLDEEVSGEVRQTFFAMQEDVNELIARLPFYESASEAEGDIQIATPYGTLFYPGQWEEWLLVEQVDGESHTVGFRAVFETARLPLFDITFGAEDGKSLGMVTDAQGNEIPVGIVMYELDTEGLSEEEQETACAMQEAANDVIERLLTE